MRSNFFRFLTRSFYVKMILLMLTVSIIPLILLSYISVTVSKTTVEQQVNRVNAQLVNQVTERIELTMSRLQELSSQYSQLPSISRAIVPPTGYYDEFLQKKELLETLSTAAAVIGNVEGLQVYAAQMNEVLSSGGYPASFQDSQYNPLITSFIKANKSRVFMNKSNQPKEALLENSSYFFSRIPLELYEDMKGVMFISMNNSVFQDLIENIELGANSSITILTPEGLTIATKNKLKTVLDNKKLLNIMDHWQQLDRPEQFNLDNSIVSMKQTNTFDQWIVVSEIPSDELTQSTTIIQKTVKYFLLLLIFSGVLIVIGFGYYLYRPLQSVKRQVEAIKKGDFNARITHFANNEIGDLGLMLNTMAKRLKDLLQDLQDSEDLKRRLEMRALQSQINPHFMYNTLNTIRMFAFLEDDYNKINVMMGKLLSLLRYSMENYEQTVQLKQETNYITDYLELLEMRYDCRFLLETDIDPALERMMIPKLILQPLIENAVFHGILPKKIKAGQIRIRAHYSHEHHNIYLEFEDNGKGVSKSQLQQLQLLMQRKEVNEHIGLFNVWERLRLAFGDESKCELSCDPDCGLRIRFNLPANRVQIKGDEHEAI